MGSITVLAGDPGLGKSLLSLNLAAALSRGELAPRAAGDVLLLTAEDSRTHTIRPRLEAAGADLARVHFGAICRDGLETTLALPHDVPALGELIESTHTQFVVVDPLMAHLASNVNSWKDQMVRQALAPLNALADETAAAILIVAHLNRGRELIRCSVLAVRSESRQLREACFCWDAIRTTRMASKEANGCSRT
jgi:putative DNA primase/helicase